MIILQFSEKGLARPSVRGARGALEATLPPSQASKPQIPFPANKRDTFQPV